MRTYHPDAWYVDATPDRRWAALMAGGALPHIRTDSHNVPLPPGGNLLYLRCAVVDGRLCLIGQGHDDGVAWLWADNRWTALSETYGTSPCAFGPDGSVYVSTPHAVDNVRIFDVRTRQLVRTLTRRVGARGIATIDASGFPMSIDDWYGRDGFAEYTDVGDAIWIGQGAQGGLVAKVGFGHMRLIEPGSVQFIRVQRQGQQLAVSAWKDREGGAVIHWLTVAELAALPLLTDTPPPPPPPPDKEPPVSVPNRLKELKEMRAEYPVLITPPQAVELLNRFCFRYQDEGFGLLSKPGGNRSPQPGTDIDCSIDWLTHKPTLTGTDVLGSGPNATFPPGHKEFKGKASPQWGSEWKAIDPKRFVAPVKPLNTVPDPIEPPDPVEPPNDDPAPTPLEWEVALKLLAGEVKDLQEDVRKLKAMPAAALPPYRAKGRTKSTGGFLSHSHEFDVPVVPDA